MSSCKRQRSAVRSRVVSSEGFTNHYRLAFSFHSLFVFHDPLLPSSSIPFLALWAPGFWSSASQEWKSSTFGTASTHHVWCAPAEWGQGAASSTRSVQGKSGRQEEDLAKDAGLAELLATRRKHLGQ